MRSKIFTFVCLALITLLLLSTAFLSCNKAKKDGSVSVPPADTTTNHKSPTKFMNVTAVLVDSTGKPLRGLFCTVIPDSIPQDFILPFYPEIGAWTDSSGKFTTAALSNTTDILTVYLKAGCKAGMYAKSISLRETDTSLGNIIIPLNPVSIDISGTVTKCNNEPANIGTVMIEEDVPGIAPENQKRYLALVKADGTFKFALPSCPKTDSVPVMIHYQDPTGTQIGNRVYYSIKNSGNNVGKIAACNNADTTQFITYTFDSTSHTYYFPDNPDSHPENPVWTFFFAVNPVAEDTLIYFGIDGKMAVGKPGLSLVQFDIHPGYGEHAASPPVVNITEYGPVGGYIAGDIKLQIEKLDTSHSGIDAKCSFRVKRKQ